MSVFISYSSQDRRIAETICKALETRGHRCWIAFRDVKAGENFQEAIVKALREARVMLLVFSSNANNSEEIKKELVLAGRHRITVMPVRIEDVAPSDAFAYELATRQWVDLFRDWESEIEGLSLQIGRLDTPGPPNDAGGKREFVAPAGKKSSLPLAMGIAAAILVLLGAAALFYWKPGASVPKVPPPEQAVAKASAAPVQTAAQTPSISSPPVAQASPAESSRTQTSPAPAQPVSKPVRARPNLAAAAPPAPTPAATETAQKTEAPPPPAATDDQAWQTAVSANTRAAFGDYLESLSRRSACTGSAAAHRHTHSCHAGHGVRPLTAIGKRSGPVRMWVRIWVIRISSKDASRMASIAASKAKPDSPARWSWTAESKAMAPPPFPAKSLSAPA